MRVVPAPAKLVFRMMSEPERVAEWFGPQDFSVPSVELDARVGGKYRLTMQPPEGDAFFLFGEFREVDPDRRLVYTFRYDPPDPIDPEMVVVVSLRDLGESTEVALDQGPFATEARRTLHENGWTDSLDRLGELLATQEL